MGWFATWWKWVFGSSEARRADVTAAIFAESDGAEGSEDWREPKGMPRAKTPAEALFQADYEQSLPKQHGVEQVLASPKGVFDVLSDERKASKMKLIVGLGNPGSKYVGTRHNIGYQVLAELGKRYGTGSPKSRFQGELLDASIGGVKALLLSPVTYMNLSGRSVRPCVDFYRIERADMLVLCDDVHLPVGKLRVRSKGSAGGQKGLNDVIRVMGSDEVPRLRVGVGECPGHMDRADYVLSRFNKEEAEWIAVAVQQAADAVELWAREGIERCMDRYNGMQ